MKRTLTVILFLALWTLAEAGGQKPEWLRNAVIYQVYPSSYADSDGNGIGDIAGIESKLDYIASLGVDVIWFNPLFHSGWIDGGYDILDYYSVDPRFGTNSDLERLVGEAHKRNIRVFLDLVPGHTSVDHPWFRESMNKRDSKYSDYYIWADDISEKDKATLALMLKTDNPMQSTLGKWMSSDAPRARYYYKNFYACQPALNFGYAKPNPSKSWEQSVDAPGPRAVKRELMNIIAFWYDKGVDGFRVDMAQSLVKGDKDKKATQRFWQEIRKWMDENYPEHVLMAEWSNPRQALGAGFNVDMCLNSMKSQCRTMYFARKHQAEGGSYFSLDGCAPSVRDLYGNEYSEGQIDRTSADEALLRYYTYMVESFDIASSKGYFATITGNHDHLRFNTGPRNTPEQLKVMMTWVMTMPLPILYYGDEIGMKSLAGLPNREGANHDGKERAGARTPMQWTSGPTAGFSTCPPEKLYLPVCTEWTPCYNFSDYVSWKADPKRRCVAEGEITVESQDNDPRSILNWTRSLITFRHETPAMWADAAWIPIRTEEAPYPMIYMRRAASGDTYLVAMNPTARRQSVRISHEAGRENGTIRPSVMTGHGSYQASPKGDVIRLNPVSAAIFRIR